MIRNELQTAIKELRNQGIESSIKLNAKNVELKEEYDRMLAALEDAKAITTADLTADAFNVMMGLPVDSQEEAQAELDSYIESQAITVVEKPAQNWSAFDAWDSANMEMHGQAVTVLVEAVEVLETVQPSLGVVEPVIVLDVVTDPLEVLVTDAAIVVLIFLRAFCVVLTAILQTACQLARLTFYYASVLQVLYNRYCKVRVRLVYD